MPKKTLLSTLIVILVFSTCFTIQTSTQAAATDPVALKLYTGPPSVPSDNNTYPCVYVQLQDAAGKPARAVQDTTVTLSSSLTYYGSVQPAVTIPKGATFAQANFTSTFSPGTTVLSASASGFATVQASMVTVGTFPIALMVYGVPSVLPSDGGTYSAVLVQLQDSTGTPAKAPKGGVTVGLSCSDTSVGEVSPSVVIEEGTTSAVANFTTAIIDVKQSAKISTIAQGYTSQQTTITTTPVAPQATSFAVYTGSPRVAADNKSYCQIAIAMQDASNFAAKLSYDVTVSLSSSDLSIGEIPSEVTIPAGQSYVFVNFNSTYKPGSTQFTALANDMDWGQTTLTTTGFIPSKLAVYLSPSLLASDGGSYQALQVQLQDSSGRPALDPQSNVTVSLFSSKPTVATVDSQLLIPLGQTQAYGNINVTNNADQTAITAQAPGYSTGQGILTTKLIDLVPLQVSVSAANSTIGNGEKTDINVYVSGDGKATTGANVHFTSDAGGSFSAVSDLGNGNYQTTFTAPSFTQSTTCTITATAEKTDYIQSSSTVRIIVNSPSSASQSSSSQTQTEASSPSTSSNETTTVSQTQTAGSTQINMLLHIQDSNGNPLADTTVSSTSQPVGARLLFGITNESGYVTFRNVMDGQYVFSVEKEGYGKMDKTVDVAGKPLSVEVTFSGGADGSIDLTSIVMIVIVVVVVMLLGILLVRRRRRKSAPELPPLSSFKY